jgi:glutamine synthetase
MIRIPATRGRSTRTEIRSVDTTANPYLAMAVILASGLDAIENKIDLVEPINLNLFELSQSEREKLGVKNLPENLKEAIELMQEDPLMRETLGDHIFTKFIELKEREWDDYSTAVTDWEIKRYLNTI